MQSHSGCTRTQSLAGVNKDIRASKEVVKSSLKKKALS
jgi:hypothetical protein